LPRGAASLEGPAGRLHAAITGIVLGGSMTLVILWVTVMIVVK
jgi:hypothetical protein